MRVTEAQIKKLIHQSNLIEGYDDPAMDAQGLLAWHFLQELDIKDLMGEDIRKVQQIIVKTQDDLQPQWRGEYREIPVWVGGVAALSYWLVEAHMIAWLYRTNHNNWASTKESHITFEKIHPFVDGNGRTGRLLLWWLEMKIDQPLTKITFADRQNYYSWFK